MTKCLLYRLKEKEEDEDDEECMARLFGKKDEYSVRLENFA